METHVNVSHVRRMTHVTLFGCDGLIIQSKKRNTFYNEETKQLSMIVPMTEVVGVVTLDKAVALLDSAGNVRDIVESAVSPSLLGLDQKIRYTSGDQGVVAVATLSDGFCTVTQHGGRTSCNLHRAGRKTVLCLEGEGRRVERGSQACPAVIASCLLRDMCPVLAGALLPAAARHTTSAAKRARLASPHTEAVLVGLATGDVFCLVALPGGRATEARLIYRCETQGVVQVLLLDDPELSGSQVGRVGVVCGGGMLTLVGCHPSSLRLSYTTLYLPCAALAALAIPGRCALVTADGSALMRHLIVPEGQNVALSSEVLREGTVSFLAGVPHTTSAFALTASSVLLHVDLLRPPASPPRARGADDSMDSTALNELYARLEAQEQALEDVQRALTAETQRCQALSVCLRGRCLRGRFHLSVQVENVFQLVNDPNNNIRRADVKVEVEDEVEDDLKDEREDDVEDDVKDDVEVNDENDVEVVVEGDVKDEDMSIDDEDSSDLSDDTETKVEDVADNNLAEGGLPPRPPHCNAAGSYIVHLTAENRTGLVFPAHLWSLHVAISSGGVQHTVARPLTEEMATVPLTWRIPCHIASPLTASLQCDLVLSPGVGGGRSVDLGSCPLDPSCFFYVARDGVRLARHLAVSRLRPAACLQRCARSKAGAETRRCWALKPALCRRSLSLPAALTHAGLATALAVNTYRDHKGSVVPARSPSLPPEATDPAEITGSREFKESRGVMESRELKGSREVTEVVEVTPDLPREVEEALEVDEGRVSLFVGTNLIHLYLDASGTNLTVTCHSDEVLDVAVPCLSKLLYIENS